MLAVDRQVDLVREVHPSAASIAEVRTGAPGKTGNEGPRQELGQAYSHTCRDDGTWF
jgi:hypothetical protein